MKKFSNGNKGENSDVHIIKNVRLPKKKSLKIKFALKSM